MNQVVAKPLQAGDIDESGNKYFPVHQKQWEAINCDKPIVAVVAGTGGGKSYCAVLWLAQQIRKHPKGEFIVVSPSFSFMNRTILKELKKCFRDTDVNGIWQENKKRYLCDCGASIWFFSADNPESIEGIHAHGAVIDEAGQMSYDVFDATNRRVSQKDGQIFISTTPYKFNWLYDKIYMEWKNGNDEIECFSFPSTLNPTYSKKKYEANKKSMAPWRFKMMHLGEFTRPDGLVYPEMNMCICEVSELPPIASGIHGGLDFGFNHATVALAGYLAPNKQNESTLWIVYEKYKTGQSLSEFCTGYSGSRKLGEPLLKKPMWWCDNARPDSIKQLRRELGFNARKAKKGPGSLQAGIDLVTGLIRSGRLKLLRDATPNLLKEADLYTYKPAKKEGEFLDQPLPINDDACDALRYLCLSLQKRF